jgi:hypothetical protein
MASQEFEVGEIIIIRGAKISDYGGKTLNLDSDHAEIFRERADLKNLNRYHLVDKWYKDLNAEHDNNLDITALLNQMTRLSSTRINKTESFLRDDDQLYMN